MLSKFYIHISYNNIKIFFTLLIPSILILSKMFSHNQGMVVLRISPCLEWSLCSFGNFPGVWSLKADVSELNVDYIVLGDQE